MSRYTPWWLHNLLDPNSPFIPWVLLLQLLVLLVHLYIVYWVYRDAAWRYNRGAPWGLATALLPLGGWMFYLAYRRSPLVALDREDAELFDDTEHQWTDYDDYKQRKGAGLFRELVEEGRSYSQRVRMSRLRELRGPLTPEERSEVRELRRRRRSDARQQRAERRLQARAAAKQKRVERRERATVSGAHGTTYKLSERRQRAMQRKLAVVEQLRSLPREDAALEELIYEMRYAEALEQARESLAVALELEDAQGVATFQAYVERLERLVDVPADQRP